MRLSSDALRELGVKQVKGECTYTGKIGFTSEDMAAAECKRLRTRPHPRGPRVPAEPYICGHCGRWHVGRRWAAYLEAKS
jgi:hypothetical protein